ncbi:MAG: 3-dehydroquinate synthase [Phycisphaeraceae bacterium]|nr:3-dehydroquinate synthase [Phycisphaeraceae bacterium]
MIERINVPIPGAACDVHIEPDGIDRLGTLLDGIAPHASAFVVMDARVAPSAGARAVGALERAGRRVCAARMEASESRKSLAEVARLLDELLLAGADRRTPLIAVGGGIVGDTAGFTASIYQRGMPFIQVPTTLLAMIDAAIGGKTGVNLPLPTPPGDAAPAGAADQSRGALGKNLAGTFWQPRLVLADPMVLGTLDDRDFRAGLAEGIKHAVIAGEPLFSQAEAWIRSARPDAGTALVPLIAGFARVKVGIVAGDEREAGRREVLNLGHTFGHAIESILHDEVRHGEAVAIGLVAAASAAVQTGAATEALPARLAEMLGAAGLPRRLPSPVPADALTEAMRFDKKNRAGVIRLVLPHAIGRVEIGVPVADAVIRRAWLDVGAAG